MEDIEIKIIEDVKNINETEAKCTKLTIKIPKGLDSNFWENKQKNGENKTAGSIPKIFYFLEKF